ncbi:MAG: hypothetical protein IKF50_08640 [Clostridia bacterium]|nr:hypothetical protein [Clostridia bacterium]
MENKKTSKIWIILIVVLLIALSGVFLVLRSCAASKTERLPEVTAADSAEKQENEITQIPGQYEITEMVTGGKATEAEDLALMKEKGLTCMITLEADGSGVLNLFGEERDLTWDTDTISASGKKMPFVCEGDRLILSDGDSSLTFTRIK